MLDVNQAVACFNEALANTLSEHAPEITKLFVDKKVDYSNPEILRSRRLRRKYERKFRKHKRPCDLEMYKKFETRHKNMVKAYQHNNWTLDQSFKLLNSRGKNV